MKTKKLISLHLFCCVMTFNFLLITLAACGGLDGRDVVAVPQSGQSTDIHGKWIWIAGDSETDQLGVYGAKGITAATNKPGGRSDAVSWIDSEGNLCLFGGDAGVRYMKAINDLWKFDGTAWTWVSGDRTEYQRAIYGTKGVTSKTNDPGGRSGSINWIDSKGHLWLFGGRKSYRMRIDNYLNDLWMLEP